MHPILDRLQRQAEAELVFLRTVMEKRKPLQRSASASSGVNFGCRVVRRWLPSPLVGEGGAQRRMRGPRNEV